MSVLCLCLSTGRSVTYQDVETYYGHHQLLIFYIISVLSLFFFCISLEGKITKTAFDLWFCRSHFLWPLIFLVHTVSSGVLCPRIAKVGATHPTFGPQCLLATHFALLILY